MRTHLARAPARHFVIAQYLQRAGWQTEIDRVEYEHAPRRFDVLEQVEAERAAVEQHHVRRRKRKGCIQRLDGAHAETFVGPEQIADAQDQDFSPLVHVLACNAVGYS